MSHNFTLADLAAVAEGFFIFALFAFAPGYVIGWLLDLFQFRRRSFLAKAALSTPLSIAFCPLLTYLVARALPFITVWVLYGIAWFLFVLLLGSAAWHAHRCPTQPGPHTSKWSIACLALVSGWVLLGMLSLVDLQIGGRLYFSMATFDQCVRTGFTNAISTFGIPAQNPFFYPGHPVPLRYHYFWLIPASLVDQLGGAAVGPRHAIVAGTLWCGIGLMSTIVLYLRFFGEKGERAIRRRAFVGIVLLGITGLDIVPTVLLLLLYYKGLLHITPSSVEFWNNPIAGWLLTMLWQPHYLVALIACLAGFLVISDAVRANRLRRWILAAAAGAAFATALGSAVYMAFAFAIFLALWTAITLLKRSYGEVAVLAVAGVSAILLSAPLVREFSGPSSGGAFVQLTIRSFYPAEIFLGALHTSGFGIAIANALFLPINYFMELGFFFAIGFLQWRNFRARRWALTRPELAATAMLATSALVCTFLRSGIIINNDLGWRACLLGQFVLLVWAAEYLSQKTDWRQKRALIVLLVLGAAGTVYDLTMQRAFLAFSDAGIVSGTPWLPSSRDIGHRTYSNRTAYEWLQRHSRPSAIIQHNPDVGFQDTYHLAYSNRRAAAIDLRCGSVFGGDPKLCPPVVNPIKKLFSVEAGYTAPDSACRDLPVEFLVVHDTDSVWNDKRSWVWTRRPVHANGFVRIFRCHDRASPIFTP